MATKTITTCDVCGAEMDAPSAAALVRRWELVFYVKAPNEAAQSRRVWDVCCACMARIRESCRAEENIPTYKGPAISTKISGRSG